jgi:hypothetical protein
LRPAVSFLLCPEIDLASSEAKAAVKASRNGARRLSDTSTFLVIGAATMRLACRPVKPKTLPTSPHGNSPQYSNASSLGRQGVEPNFFLCPENDAHPQTLWFYQSLHEADLIEANFEEEA